LSAVGKPSRLLPKKVSGAVGITPRPERDGTRGRLLGLIAINIALRRGRSRDRPDGLLHGDVKQNRESQKMRTCKRLIAAGGMALGLLTLSVILSTDALAEAPAQY
jgi:hypothetical protein